MRYVSAACCMGLGGDAAYLVERRIFYREGRDQYNPIGTC